MFPEDGIVVRDWQTVPIRSRGSAMTRGSVFPEMLYIPLHY